MATKKIDWDQQIGRRLSLRQLHVFSAVVQHGSMAKAARQLGVSQPAVSEVVAELEHTFGLRLLDRSSQGVMPTLYGDALLKRAVAVFDELKQSSRDLEFLANPTTGELRIGFQESLSPALLAPTIRRFSEQYPGVVVHMDDLPSADLQLLELRARRYDLTLALLTRPLTDEDLNVEVLFNDQLAIVADKNSRWARRRKVELAELVDEPWIMTPPGTWAYVRLEEAFQAAGLALPKAALVALSVPLRAYALTNSKYLTSFPRSTQAVLVDQLGLAFLPVELPSRPWPAVIVTLKNRTLSPVVGRFIECLRSHAKAIAP